MRISLQRALLLLLGGVLAVSLVPAWLVLDRRLAADLESEAREDLAMAPPILADREAARARALRMDAEKLAATPGLARALAAGDRAAALRALQGVRDSLMKDVLLLKQGGETWLGSDPWVDRMPVARAGTTRIELVPTPDAIRVVALAPVSSDGELVGEVGTTTAVDDDAATLAALTRSEVVVSGPEGRVLAATGDRELAKAVADSASRWRGDEQLHELAVPGSGRHWIAVGSLDRAGSVSFLRAADEELAVLPRLRQGALLAGLLALALALALGATVAAGLARPVRALARASDRVADGDFDVELEPSRIREVDRVRRAFEDMRSALAAKLEELAAANEELQERQERLQALQAEMIQRDRLVASGRLVTELAHEIRNPVANVRNCLEVIQRRLGDEPEAGEFVDMAIDELLRMHELAEQMLELNRPIDPDARHCRPHVVARQVAELAQAGDTSDGWSMRVTGQEGVHAAIAPDPLKQVLLNLVQNAREATSGEGNVEIRLGTGDGGSVVTVEVTDDGPGIPPGDLPKVFDPFFTTKGEVHGVGLGLFVAEGTVRRYGGRLTAANREGTTGARFRIELPIVQEGPGERAAGGPGGRTPDGEPD